jgi:Zn-dependent peptidase ImmA (M78 family)
MSTLAAPTPLRQTQTKVQIPWSSPVQVKGMRSKVKKQAEKDAARLWEADPGDTFAVDPFGIARRLGIEVREPELDPEIRGALFLRPETDPKICVNRRQGFLRRRLTCAHELGHYLHMSAQTNEYKRVDLCDSSQERGGHSDDRYAAEFAACLLMPTRMVEVLAELGMDDLEMALRLFVPRESIQVRMRGLGLPAPDLQVS